MTPKMLAEILERVAGGTLSVSECVERLRTLPFEDLGFARFDHHRSLRCGMPEAILSEGKTPDQTAQLFQRAAESGANVLATRVDARAWDAIQKRVSQAVYDEISRTVWLDQSAGESYEAVTAIVTAGTADMPVAEEARVTLASMGCKSSLHYDVGVAGLHRLLDCFPQIQKSRVCIVAAGMDAALASVVGGLYNGPVIAVPTSVGYGSAFQGVSALLSMLNSCAPTVSVVNIDDGFGAGCVAAAIVRAIKRGPGET